MKPITASEELVLRPGLKEFNQQVFLGYGFQTPNSLMEFLQKEFIGIDLALTDQRIWPRMKIVLWIPDPESGSGYMGSKTLWFFKVSYDAQAKQAENLTLILATLTQSYLSVQLAESG